MLVLKWLYLLECGCIYWTMLVLKWLYLLDYVSIKVAVFIGLCYASIKVAVFIGLC